jgi:hypothetical protein
MRQTLAVAAVAVAIGLPGTQIAAAQDTKTARGLVRTTEPSAVTIQLGSSNEMTLAPAAGVSRASDAVGVVTAVTNALLTIKGDSGDLTYAINGKTKVFGRGLGTQARASKRAGERTLFSQFVHMGDTVKVHYEEKSGINHALEVHVTSKSN